MSTLLTPPAINSSRNSSGSSSIVVVIVILASAIVVSASIYLLRRRSTGQTSETGDLIDSLPLFTFRSVNPGTAAGDCAVCLSRFEPRDRLRLLPLCCHAFHASCIDTWIASNRTCPLCRSPVLIPSEVLGKILPAESRGKIDDAAGGGGSFRIEIGNISGRRAAEAEAETGRRRSYLVGSFEYVLNESGYEVSVSSTTHSSRRFSDFKPSDKDPPVETHSPEPPLEVFPAEVSSHVREYVDRLAPISTSSRTMSFRSSGRFFSGSSRRSDDLEAYRAGEEISELFRWLSGV